MDEHGGVQLGHRLAQLRERTGMKQAELARKITWSPAMLSRIEAGDRSISDEELATMRSVPARPPTCPKSCRGTGNTFPRLRWITPISTCCGELSR
jgi:DNA-binding XRE family transcriptional regulator